MYTAIVDLGSNTVRVSVYRLEDAKSFKLMFSEKEMVGLANYISQGVLSEEGIARACEVLTEFAGLLEQLGIGEMHVFATASVRNIRNTREVVEAIRERTGVALEVLSGDEEAELGYYGALQTLDLRSGAMFDIGGGSTELVQVEEGHILRAQSLPLGSLTLFNQHVAKIWPKDKELKAIRAAVEQALDRAELPKSEPQRVCGVGGTARAVLKIAGACLDLPAEERRLTPKQLHKLAGILSKRDVRARKLILNACPDRLHTILPGILLMEGVCRKLNAQELYISRFGVREGYLCRRLLEKND